jgi:outer membrane lipoprotein-sorting protein
MKRRMLERMKVGSPWGRAGRMGRGLAPLALALAVALAPGLGSWGWSWAGMGALAAQQVTGSWILQRVDENLASSTKVSRSRMVIEGRGGARTVESQSWIRGTTESFTEYLAPPRDRGTKMLKLGDQLWTYFPDTDRTILIAGHMLRQSVMGSDLSYEDLMEDPHLFDMYGAEILREELLGDRPCWVLGLEALDTSPAYHSREMWVDKERFVPLKENRFARSGRLLKTTEVVRVERQGSRWVAREMVFKDVLKTGSGTRFILDSIEFDADIPSHLLSKAALRR